MEFQPPVVPEWPARQPLIDLATPFPRRWFGGDAFKTAFFNSLSMTFVLASQFFTESVLRGLATLPIDERARFSPQVKGFVGQEAIHQRVHAQFNAHLETAGFVNRIAERFQSQHVSIKARSPLHSLAAVAALGHFSTLVAGWMLSSPEMFSKADPRVRDMWLWHAAEDAEHNCVAFEMYETLHGSLRMRRHWMRRAKFQVSYQLARQTASNLWQDRALFKLSTWRSAARFLFGAKGLLPSIGPQIKAFGEPGFHPAAFRTSLLAQRWLEENSSKWMMAGVSKPR